MIPTRSLIDFSLAKPPWRSVTYMAKSSEHTTASSAPDPTCIVRL